MLFLILFKAIFCDSGATLFHLKDPERPFILIEDVIENQICQGFFQPVECKNVKYGVRITGEKDGLFYFYSDGIDLREETHFSFNCSEPQKFKVTMTPSLIDSESEATIGKMKYSFNMDFNKFKKEIAENEIKYAIRALDDMTNLFSELKKKTLMKKDMILNLKGKRSRSFKFVVYFSFGSMGLLIGLRLYCRFSMKKFLKTKKII
ncbi:hypothetical protein EDEG_02185 [Edhazardia aedis USNM 41457]|uniref:GOLD domain-containing protein n=1 Tax=Edhazardia aedis (strain USNM 41457) TaxID=1003232 RepID=J9D7J2_EDHAE|nr:hypothetical protein EDEG_02185 [Edhazardia aedis USNM 41457]|eukprot:EJW03489.1 hypothetical protein EDEG_02185 [Edhazardia aedis USNM 41457]